MTRIIHAGIVQPFIRLAVVGLRVTDGQKQFDAAPPPPLPGILQRCRMKRRRVHAEVLEQSDDGDLVTVPRGILQLSFEFSLTRTSVPSVINA